MDFKYKKPSKKEIAIAASIFNSSLLEKVIYAEMLTWECDRIPSKSRLNLELSEHSNYSGRHAVRRATALRSWDAF